MTDAPTAAADRPGRGIAYISLGVFVFATQDALVKWLVADYPVMQILLFRAVFALIPCAVVIARSGGVAALRTARPGLHAGRGALLLGSLVLLFLAYRRLPLADAIAISFSAPLFMTALSAPLLGEPVGARRWSAVVVGFLGVLVITRPGAGMIEPAALMAVASSALYALAMIGTRRLSRTDSVAAIMFYFIVLVIAVSALCTPFVWVAPNPRDAALLAATGLIGGVAAFLFIQAYRLAPVAVVAPFDYTALVWAGLYGVWLWGDVPGPAVLAGAAIIVASNLYILRRETKRPDVEPAPRPRA